MGRRFAILMFVTLFVVIMSGCSSVSGEIQAKTESAKQLKLQQIADNTQFGGGIALVEYRSRPYYADNVTYYVGPSDIVIIIGFFCDKQGVKVMTTPGFIKEPDFWDDYTAYSFSYVKAE